MNFNGRTHALALALLAAAAGAATWYLHHQAQIAAVAQFIVNHPAGSIGGVTGLILAALYNPST